jgi:hypothetical protein
MNGFLYSQIGYDRKDPKRALVRSKDKSYLSEKAEFYVYDSEGTQVFNETMKYWGEKWHLHWWEADFSSLEKGEYILQVIDKEKILYKSEVVTVDENRLWDETVVTVALDQFEARAALARNGRGWKDCGSILREANSHATSIIGLCDLLALSVEWLSRENQTRLKKQIVHGCDYLALCQDRAEDLGLERGSMVHEIPSNNTVIPGNIAQTVVALSRASSLLFEDYREKSADYLSRAESAYDFLINRLKPYGKVGFSASNHGAPKNFIPPAEFMTRDLLMMLWGGTELVALGKGQFRDTVLRLTRQILSRQVPKERAEEGLYGHFYTFDSCDFTEKANIHHHVGHDTGCTFPHYLIPLINMIKHPLWSDLPERVEWEEAVKNFAYGYFLPACRANPFYLLSEGYFTGEGLLNFSGPWHGINTTYGFAAALAVKLEHFTSDRAFREISVGNLQWIAGLNAGITSESFEGGCVFWHDDIPKGQALPYSQIYGIGHRYTGNWSNIPGSIPNGFSVNPQFTLSVEPSLDNDEPKLYTDEDWIPHGAAWVSALAYLREYKLFAD